MLDLSERLSCRILCRARMSDHFEDIRTFVAVVQAPGFAGASERLGLAKSAVSRRIQDLEDRLGSRLLHRTTRRLSLTEAGTEFYQRSLKILSDLAEAEDVASKGASEAVGRLRVSGPMSFGVLCLAPVIGEFMRRHPRVNVELVLNDRFVDLVEDGFDMAIRIGNLKDSSLIARRIAPIRLAVCASPSYFSTHGTPSTPGDLREHSALLYSYAADRQIWQFQNTDPIEMRSSFKCNNGDALREAAISGCGLAYLPTFIIHGAVVAGKLDVCLTEYSREPSALYAVYPSTRNLPAKVRVFIDFLAEKFGEEPYWDRGIF
jgi:DNA-binding transcriptional LysR family regulator